MTQKVVLLMVEDHESEQFLTKLLVENGFEVLIAEKERKCYQLLASRYVDLVLLNIRRDDLEGLMLTKKIKALSKHRHTPVISVTDNRIISHAFNASWGCDEYISKPIDEDILLDKMNLLMEKYFF